MNKYAVRGTCLAQHADGIIADPSKPTCTGFPHLGPIKFHQTHDDLDQMWDDVRFYLQPTWTLVAVERWNEHMNQQVWWVYAEPSSVEEPETQRRLDRRVNAEHPNRERAFTMLATYLRDGRHLTESRILLPGEN